MGLTCRLLGHSYGDTETEREREERGDEVVVSVRELQVCSRCGHEHVVTENKEVTAIRTPEEVGMTDGEADTVAAGFEPAEPKPDETTGDESVIETAPDPVTEAEQEAEIIEEAENDAHVETADAETVEAESAEPEPEPEPEAETLDEPPVTDDAIILDDDEGGRDRTQWPDDVDGVEADDPTPQPTETGHDAEFIDADAEADVAESEASRDYGAWPDPPGEDEGFDARPDDGEPSSISFGGGLTPENNGAPNAESNGEFIEAASGSDDDFVRAGETSRNSDVPDDAVEYYCPNCGHARDASSSSMRAGDICPECRKGYIAEREA